MNEKAKSLGLMNTHFVNSTGLDAENHYSSAYDMAIMAKELVKHQKILEFSSIYEDYLRKNTNNSFWLVNTNKLVKFYSYIDGLKTGYTGNAGYCLTATGKKNDMRLISVVMGEETTEKRSADTLAMLDYGFNFYSIDKLVDGGDSLGMIKVNLGDPEKVDIVSKKDITILNNNQKNKRNIKYDIKTDNITAPIKQGDTIGKITIYEDGRFLYDVELTVPYDVKKANILKIFARNLRDSLALNL